MIPHRRTDTPAEAVAGIAARASMTGCHAMPRYVVRHPDGHDAYMGRDRAKADDYAARVHGVITVLWEFAR